MKNYFNMRFFFKRTILISVLVLAGCVNTPQFSEPESISENVAVNNLFLSAQKSSQLLDYEAAQAKIERAIRIESENPYLWFELAQLANLREAYNRARDLAERANRFAIGNSALQYRINKFLRHL